MKFQKLSLDESLFDDSFNTTDVSFDTTYDDEFIGSELPQDMMRGPASGSDSGVTDMILSAIHDELETIRTYNSMVETLKFESVNNPDYEKFILIINDINAEENKHVGQLQEILQKLSPNAGFIDKGREEGKQQFNFKNGLLDVQAWDTASKDEPIQLSGDTEMCTLLNVDDDM